MLQAAVVWRSAYVHVYQGMRGTGVGGGYKEQARRPALLVLPAWQHDIELGRERVWLSGGMSA